MSAANDFSDITQTRAPSAGEAPLNLDTLEQIATAAGHGHGHKPFSEAPSPWYSLEDNVRPVYDVRFIQLFNPDVVKHLVNRIRAAEDAVANPDIEAAAQAAWRNSGEMATFEWFELSEQYRDKWRTTAQVVIGAGVQLPDTEEHRVARVRAKHAADDARREAQAAATAGR